MSDGALRVRGLHKTFPLTSWSRHGPKVLRAVDNVSFDIPKGMSLGLVGESGCGKSTAARCVLRLLEPTAGEIVFDGQDLRALSGRAMRDMRRRMQIVFQDPYASLNPRRTIRQTLQEPLHVHGGMSRREIAEKAEATLAEVGLPVTALDRYPHEFSGGQRQRVGIARALVLDPDLIVADEPVSALDVSVQAQVLRLLGGLREKRGLSFLFVSHDLGVIRHFCDRTAVMYLGRVVEEGPTRQVLDHPAHHYTRLLMASSPVPDPRIRLSLPKISGEVPSPADPPTGCVFHPRCPHADDACRRERPPLADVGRGRKLACYHPAVANAVGAAALVAGAPA